MTSVERKVRIFAGTLLLISLVLSVWVNVGWLWLTAFVGFMMFQSGFTGFCPSEMVFRHFEQHHGHPAKAH